MELEIPEESNLLLWDNDLINQSKYSYQYTIVMFHSSFWNRMIDRTVSKKGLILTKTSFLKNELEISKSSLK
jgi:hypothetical protein